MVQRSSPPARRRTLAQLTGLIVVGALAACGDDDKRQVATTPTPTVPEVTVPEVAPPPPAQRTVKTARSAVDKDQYSTAAAIAPSLSRAERRTIDERIANRLARRIRAAVRVGNRSLAQSLLAQSARYPRTRLLRSVRSEYRRAETRASQRAVDRTARRRLQSLQRRQRAAARRAAEQAREAARKRARRTDEP
jgi:hypothetical protein